MLSEFDAENFNDDKGKPAGGYVRGQGLDISWQDGPLGRGEDRQEPNGAFVETVIAAARQRLKYYQASEFACEENAASIDLLGSALTILNDRTKDREARGVEGIHTV